MSNAPENKGTAKSIPGAVTQPKNTSPHGGIANAITSSKDSANQASKNEVAGSPKK
jgi:hypothetical protein